MQLISIQRYRALKNCLPEIVAYRQKIESLSKSDLLAELLRYHEDYLKNPGDIKATLKGKSLMDVLEERAELNELKSVSLEFRRKLQQRLERQLQPEPEMMGALHS